MFWKPKTIENILAPMTKIVSGLERHVSDQLSDIELHNHEISYLQDLVGGKTEIAARAQAILAKFEALLK